MRKYMTKGCNGNHPFVECTKWAGKRKAGANSAPHATGTNGSVFLPPDPIQSPQPEPAKVRPPELLRGKPDYENALKTAIEVLETPSSTERSFRTFSKIEAPAKTEYHSHVWTQSPFFEGLKCTKPPPNPNLPASRPTSVSPPGPSPTSSSTPDPNEATASPALTAATLRARTPLFENLRWAQLTANPNPLIRTLHAPRRANLNRQAHRQRKHSR
jgi:hypothetical protein